MNITPQMVAEVRQAALEDRFPDMAALRPDVPQPQATAGDVFGASDLTLDMLPRGVEYVVPGSGGKRLWVFGATCEDTQLMLSWSLRPELLAPEPGEPQRQQLAQAQLMQDLKLCQVVLCTRQGPERSAARCFGRQDLPALKSRLGSAVVEEIVRISNEMSGNDEALGGGVRRFFACIRRCLQTLPSASDTSDGSPDGWNVIRARLLSLVTRALSRGSLDAGMLTELSDVEALL